MISASLSVVLGLLAWVAAAPVLAPAIGLALGLNAIVKTQRVDPRPSAFWIACVGSLVSGSAVAIALASRFGAF